MRILVAEPLAEEGVELLRAHHDVDDPNRAQPRGIPGRPARGTTRWSSAAR